MSNKSNILALLVFIGCLYYMHPMASTYIASYFDLSKEINNYLATVACLFGYVILIAVGSAIKSLLKIIKTINHDETNNTGTTTTP